MGILSELRHLDGIKGNFYVSDTEYIAPATFHEEGRVASQLIYSNLKEIVGQQHYVFDTLWDKAIPAAQRIREIERGAGPSYKSRIIEDQDAIIKEIARLTAESNRLNTCISSGGLQYSYNHFFEEKKKLLEKQEKGDHEGVRYISNINKDNVELVKVLLDAGIEIRHVKNLPPMSFGVSDKEAAATIEKMHDGKKVQSLLISNEPLYVTHFTSLFEELWKDGIDGTKRIKNIEEGVDSTNIEIIENPRETLKIAADMVKSARDEVLRIYPSVTAFHRQVKVGAVNLFREAINHNVRVRIVIPCDENELKQIVDELSLVLPQLDIRSIDKTLEAHIGIIVVDKKESLIVESKDGGGDSYYEAAGLAAYSNSKPIALSYASIFESLWRQTEMYEKYRAYSKMQRKFINVAAHELRTPVQPIIGLTEDLYSRAQEGQQRDSLNVICRNAKRLQRLVEDILDVTRIESDTLKVRKEPFNLEEVVLNVINDIKNSKEFQYGKLKNIKLEYELENKYDGNIFVNADKVRIHQVIYNLLSNAIKFTEEGGVVRVMIRVERVVDFDKATRNNYRDSANDSASNGIVTGKHVVAVLVKDTGIGIDSEMFPRLFTKFASKSFEGTGLGLFISKKIIEAHDGKIWAKNNDDDENAKGATFAFSLPLV